MTSQYSQADLERRRVRYRELIPCTTAFVDTRTPGNQKENFAIIGPGVAENPDQHVHINIPHGFNVGGVRQEPHAINSQHSHETAEVFVVQNGRWTFRWGVEAEDGEIQLGPGDVISIPTQVFRGFENTGTESAYMFSVLGGDDPGRVTWAPRVFELAEEYGLVLLENGRLIDTANGEEVPADAAVMPPTSPEIIAGMRRLTLEDMQGCVYRAGAAAGQGNAAPAGYDGVTERPVIGAAAAAEGLDAGKMAWPHGFHLRRLEFAVGGAVREHQRLEEEVIYVHQGELRAAWQGGELTLGPGDVLSVPLELSRRFENAGDGPAVAYVIRGGDAPAAPRWATAAA